jgi:high-affinity Fe2+/Pb2+ permease
MTRRQPGNEVARYGAAGVAAGLGCSIVVTVVLFIGGGLLVDQWRDSAPVFTLVGVGIALMAAGYQLWELAHIGRTDARSGPLTRGIQRLPGPPGSRRGDGTRVETREDEE